MFDFARHLPLNLGEVRITLAAAAELDAAGMSAVELLVRHAAGDWGDVDEEDTRANDQATIDGGRVLSAYTLPTGKVVWVITEADRSITTILRPDDY